MVAVSPTNNAPTVTHSVPGPYLQFTPLSNGQAIGMVGVGVSVGSGVSVGKGVEDGISVAAGNARVGVSDCAGGWFDTPEGRLQAERIKTNKNVIINLFLLIKFLLVQQ